MISCAGGNFVPDLKIDTNIIWYIIVVVFLGILVMTQKGRLILKYAVRIVLAAIFIYLFNLVGKNFSVTIPFNIFTSCVLGFLEIPGLALIFIIEYIILPH